MEDNALFRWFIWKQIINTNTKIKFNVPTKILYDIAVLLQTKFSSFPQLYQLLTNILLRNVFYIIIMPPPLSVFPFPSSIPDALPKDCFRGSMRTKLHQDKFIIPGAEINISSRGKNVFARFIAFTPENAFCYGSKNSIKLRYAFHDSFTWNLLK